MAGQAASSASPIPPRSSVGRLLTRRPPLWTSPPCIRNGNDDIAGALRSRLPASRLPALCRNMDRDRRALSTNRVACSFIQRSSCSARANRGNPFHSRQLRASCESPFAVPDTCTLRLYPFESKSGFSDRVDKLMETSTSSLQWVETDDSGDYALTHTA